MKKSLFFITAAVFSFTACSDLFNMTIPKKVSVASDANFNVNLGTLDFDLSEKLNTEGITEQMQSNLGDKMQAFVYIPDDDANTPEDESDILSYIIHYPVYEVPIDLSSYINNLDFDGTFGGEFAALNCNQTIELPEVKGGDEVPVGLDFINEFKAAINTNLAANTFSFGPLPEPNITIPVDHHDITVNSEAERIYYKEGSAVVLTFTKTDSNDCSNSFVFTGHGFISSDGTNPDLGSGVDTDVKDGGQLVIPLDTVDGLPSVFHICLTGEISGGNPLIEHSYTVTFSLADGSDLKRVHNVLKTSAELGIDPVEFDMSVDTSSMDGLFESAEIGSGHIEMSTSPISGWSGIGTDISFTFAGSDISGSKISDGPDAATTLFDKIADLSGTQIVPDGNPIDISGSVAIEVYGADINFETDISDLTINYSYEIETLENVVVDLDSPNYSSMPKSVALSTDPSTPPYIKLDSALVNYINTVNFGTLHNGNYYKHSDADVLDTSAPGDGLGFQIKVTNTLPTDDLVFMIHSDLFQFDLEQELTQGVTDEVEKWIQYPELNFSSLDSSVDHYVDFSFELKNTVITLDEVTLGETYEFGLNFEKMLFDWDYITLKTDDGSSGSAQSGSTSLDGFDLKSLLSGLSLDDSSIQNIKIKTLPVFLYAQKPTSNNGTLGPLLENLRMRGTLSIDYEHDDDMDPQTPNVPASYVMLNEEPLEFMDQSVSWPSDINTIIASDDYAASHTEGGKTYDSSVIPNITHVDDPVHPYYSFDKELADIINEYPENMVFNYNLNLTNSGGGEAKIYSAWIDDSYASNNEVSNINIDMAIVLSFNLKLTGDITLDAMKYYDEEWNGANADKDLLNREDSNTFEKFADYCDAVNQFGMIYTVENTLFKGLELKATMEDQATGINNKTITLLENKDNTLNFSGLEIKKILNTTPFHPNATVSMIGGTQTNPKFLTFSRSAIDSDKGAKLAATVKVFLDLTDREYITVYGD